MSTDYTFPPGTNLPHHIAIIPDGNRRWARARGLPTLEGHRRGFEAATKIIRAAREMGVHTTTVWAFSTENWTRSQKEIAYLMKLYEKFIDDNLKEAIEKGTRIYHLGRNDRIPKRLKEKVETALEKTKNNLKNVLNIGLDYGGHDEILRAINKAAGEGAAPKKLMEEAGKYNDKYPIYHLAKYLDTADQPYPYPDLIIRTSNEKRLSGFMSWQACYAEIYWEKDHFPDFTPLKLKTAILDYSSRNRRFGGGK